MNKPKLAYLVSQYPAFSHTFILREIQQLRTQGFQIDVASINLPDRVMSALTDEERQEAEATLYVKAQGLTGAIKALVYSLNKHPLALFHGVKQAIRLAGWDIKHLVYQMFYLIEALIVGTWLEKNACRHLHVHFATPAASVGLLTKTVFSIGLSITVHGPDEFYDAPGYNLPQKIAAADFILCISHYARSQLMKLSPVSEWHKFEICPLGVDHTRFQPSPDNSPATNDHHTLLCVGRLTPAKGQHILLNALRLLLDQGHNIKLYLVGDGPDKNSLQKYAAELGIARAVEFAGAVDQEHIRDYYQRATLFVLASFAEGLPVVLMEAMAMAIPCVTTRITGIPELIKDGVNGLLVTPSDSTDLARSIARLCDDIGFRQQLAAMGRRTTLEHYDLQRNMQYLGEVLQRRLSSNC